MPPHPTKAFRREAVHRLDKAPELRVELFGSAFCFPATARPVSSAPRRVRPAIAAVLRRQNCAAQAPIALLVIEGARLLTLLSVSGCFRAEHPLAGPPKARR